MFISDKFIHTYTYAIHFHDREDEEFFYYDGSKPTFIETLFVDEGCLNKMILAGLILGFIAGYFMAVWYVKGELKRSERE